MDKSEPYKIKAAAPFGWVVTKTATCSRYINYRSKKTISQEKKDFYGLYGRKIW
jgi:hypothetical protein